MAAASTLLLAALAAAAAAATATAASTGSGDAVLVQEVPVGATAELPCPSSDDDHRFQFWLLLDKKVLGPGSEMDPTKYKYDVLTGRLHIKAISSQESGLYTCISRAIEQFPAYNSKSVEVVVKRDWEEVYETDSATNLMRGLIAMGVLLIILVGGILIYILKRKRIIHIRDMSDEESPDETPGSYNVPNLPSMSNNSNTTPTAAPSRSQGVDNPSLETDFPQVFRSMQQTNDSQI